MRSERIRSGLTAKQASEIVDVQESTVLRWERGESNPLAIQAVLLANSYGCSVEYLLGMTDERHGTEIRQRA